MDPQLKASLERVLTIYATYFIMKYGNRIPGFDSSIVPDLLVIGGSGLSAAWGAYINRKSNLIAVTATAVPTAKIILDPKDPGSAAMAAAAPDNVTVNPK
jgi:hypothetical protein